MPLAPLDNEITGRNGIRRCPADTFAGVFPIDAAFRKRQPAGAHTAILATDSLGSDVAGFHGNCPVKGRLNPQLMGVFNHLPAGRINGSRHRIGQFLGFGLLGYFYFCHIVLLNVRVLSNH